MISIIVCSISQSLREKLEINIKETIGCPYEFLFKDNTQSPQGICAVYNQLASKAKGDYLCFVHEDVQFESNDWGVKLSNKAKEKTTGVLGFVGAENMFGYPFWNDRYGTRAYYIQRIKDGSIFADMTVKNNHITEPYQQVAVLDGMFLFCRKEIWQEIQFDDTTFTGFHMYDMDFTFAAAQKYSNYIFREAIISHFSLGNANHVFFNELIKFNQKWINKLPFSVSPQMFKKYKRKEYNRFIKWTIRDMIERAHYSDKEIIDFLRKINQYSTLLEKCRSNWYLFKLHYKEFKKKKNI